MFCIAQRRRKNMKEAISRFSSRDLRCEGRFSIASSLSLLVNHTCKLQQDEYRSLNIRHNDSVVQLCHSDRSLDSIHILLHQECQTGGTRARDWIKSVSILQMVPHHIWLLHDRRICKLCRFWILLATRTTSITSRISLVVHNIYQAGHCCSIAIWIPNVDRYARRWRGDNVAKKGA